MTANSGKQIKIGALVSYITLFLEIVIGLLYTPWMISTIGKSDYGIYSLAASFITLFVMDFGLGASVTKFLSQYITEDNQEAIDRFLGITFKLYLLIDVVLFTILLTSFVFIENIFTELMPYEIQRLRVVFSIVGLFTVINFPFLPLNGILTSYERFSFQKIFGLVSKVVQVLILIIAISLGYGLYGIVVVTSVIGILNIIIKLLYLKKYTKINIDFKSYDLKTIKELFSFSILITIVVVFEQLTLNICPTILGRVAGGTTEIAYFSVGRVLYTYVLTFAAALNGLFLPKVTRLINNSGGDMDNVNNLMVKVGRIQLFVIGLLVIGIVTMGKEFMTLWMGKDYLPSYYVALFLSVPYIIISTQNIAFTTLMVKNKMFIQVVAGGVTAVICLVIGYILAPVYGAVGVSTISSHLSHMMISPSVPPTVADSKTSS
jgi:O-antigen/teichoic acid export membrane protein